MKFLVYPIVFILLFGCSSPKQYEISGSISISVYEGRKAYLIAMDAAKTRNVDSTIIRNGKFEFSGKIDSVCVKILRIRPLWPNLVQELLVVMEPGNLNVKIDTISSGNGTPLNDSLQKWKEFKQNGEILSNNLRERFNLLQSRQLLSVSEKDSIDFALDKIEKDFDRFNFAFIKNNSRNYLGLYFFTLYAQRMTVAEKKEIYNAANSQFRNHPEIKPIFKNL